MNFIPHPRPRRDGESGSPPGTGRKSIKDVNSVSSQMIALASVSGDPDVSFVNGAWVKQGLKLKPSFQEVVEGLYNAIAKEVDFVNKTDESNSIGRAKGDPEMAFNNGAWVLQGLKLKPSFQEIVTSVYNATAKEVDFMNKGLIASGSKGRTLEQLFDCLGSRSVKDLNSQSSQMIALASSAHDPELAFVNGAWVLQGLKLKPSFQEIVKGVYNATAKEVDFVNKIMEYTSKASQFIMSMGP
ncbi:Serpin family [Corchorus capsularis]|uniref:Serpin family n=1 Tax=Corchorus capsularis TaxID=210143 RepID=A0A1R3G3A3_COCAP|nr:Serpin family [Corchorus capsularis]